MFLRTLASVLSKASTNLSSVNDSMVQYAYNITPTYLTDEYWESDASITRWNGFLNGMYCKTRYYHLEGPQQERFWDMFKSIQDESKTMKAIFRDDYENSFSYNVDKVLQIPAMAIEIAAMFVSGAGKIMSCASSVLFKTGDAYEYTVSFMHKSEVAHEVYKEANTTYLENNINIEDSIFSTQQNIDYGNKYFSA